MRYVACNTNNTSVCSIPVADQSRAALTAPEFNCVKNLSVVAALLQGAIGDEMVKTALHKTWRAAVDRAFDQVREKRIAQASQVVSSLISDMHVHLNGLIADRQHGTAEIIAGLKESLNQFRNAAEGPSKWPKLVEFLQSAIGVIVKRVEGDANARQDAASRALAETEAKLYTERADVAKLRAAAGSEEARARALEGQVHAAHQKIADEVERVRAQMQVRLYPLITFQWIAYAVATLCSCSWGNWCRMTDARAKASSAQSYMKFGKSSARLKQKKLGQKLICSEYRLCKKAYSVSWTRSPYS